MAVITVVIWVKSETDMVDNLAKDNLKRRGNRVSSGLTLVPKRVFEPSKASRLVGEIFSLISEGSLTVVFPDGQRTVYGDQHSSLKATVLVRDIRFFERLLNESSLALGESYMDGWWDVEADRLVDFIGILFANKLDQKLRGNLGLSVKMAFHRLRYGTRSLRGSKDCIKHHYDLGNDFYHLFLDPSMTYSCGYQRRPEDSLEQMQRQKYQLISSKLGLDRGGDLLDIGCGWGGMLLYAAGSFVNLRAKGVTISEQQHGLALGRISALGLSERAAVELLDYREISGSYDYIVSIGMFEHVGRKMYPIFMSKLSELLRSDGRGLLHTIALTDPAHLKTDPWIDKYIFPAGRLPRLEEIALEMQKAGLTIVHVENLRPHYAITLRHWKNNFDRNLNKIKSLGPRFDRRFIRMWNYYLQCCEAAFHYSSNQLYQILFCHSGKWPFPFPTTGRFDSFSAV